MDHWNTLRSWLYWVQRAGEVSARWSELSPITHTAAKSPQEAENSSYYDWASKDFYLWQNTRQLVIWDCILLLIALNRLYLCSSKNEAPKSSNTTPNHYHVLYTDNSSQLQHFKRSNTTGLVKLQRLVFNTQVNTDIIKRDPVTSNCLQNSNLKHYFCLLFTWQVKELIS